MNRCPWAHTDLMIAYHDREWGTPVHDDRVLFEFLLLEGAQAGLSWDTILQRRENYRRALDGFDMRAVAAYDEERIARLLQDASIIRNRLKINSMVTNARAFLKVQEEFGSFETYLWRFVDGRTVHNGWRSIEQIPARSEVGDILSKDLIQRGFKFVGPTICYAYLQTVGMVNDHLVDCYRYQELGGSI
jgi:DNA-3-methyladenine glycosylase I